MKDRNLGRGAGAARHSRVSRCLRSGSPVSAATREGKGGQRCQQARRQGGSAVEGAKGKIKAMSRPVVEPLP